MVVCVPPRSADAIAGDSFPTRSAGVRLLLLYPGVRLLLLLLIYLHSSRNLGDLF